jgi:hypothetical protein
LFSLILLCKTAVVHTSRREILHWHRSMQQVWMQPRLLGILAIIGGAYFFAIYLNAPGQGNWAYVGVLMVVAGFYLLVASIRSGIGVARDGVLVRSTLGRARWIPWPEIEKFEIITPPHWRGDYRAIAVVRRGKSPLIADACAYIPWSKRTADRKTLRDLLRALEDERIAAQGPLNRAADQDP